MGHFNLSCAMTGQSLIERDVVLFPLLKQRYRNKGGSFFHGPTSDYKLLTLPIFGYLDSYGQITPELDFNTELISNFLDENINEFVGQAVNPYRINNESLMNRVFELIRMNKRLSNYLAETDYVLNGCIVAREAWNHFISYGERAKKFIDSGSYHSCQNEFKTLGFDSFYLEQKEKEEIGASEDRAFLRKRGDIEYLLFETNYGNFSFMIRGNKRSIKPIKQRYGSKFKSLLSFLRKNGVVFTKEEEDGFQKSYMFNYVKHNHFCERPNGAYNDMLDRKNRYKTENGYIYTFPTEEYLNVDSGRFVIEVSETDIKFKYDKKYRFMHDEEFESIKNNLEKSDCFNFCFIYLTDLQGFCDFKEIEGMPISKQMFDIIKRTKGFIDVSRNEPLSKEFSLFYTELQEADKNLFFQRLADTLMFESNMNALNKLFQPTNSGLQDGCKKTQKELIKVINQILRK